MFIPSTFKRPVSSWKALNLRKTLLMASSVRLKPLNCSRLPCVYAQETLTFLCKLFNWRRLRTRRPKLGSTLPVGSVRIKCTAWKLRRFLQVALTLILVVGYRSEERFSRNAETDIVCRLLLEKKNRQQRQIHKD